MFSLQKIFGKRDTSFDLLTASAEEALHSVTAVARVVKDGTGMDVLDAFAEARQKNKAITQQIRQLLVKTSATTLEREEVERLASILEKIPRTTEKFARRYALCGANVRVVKFEGQIAILDEGARILVAMMQELKENNLAAITKQNARLQEIEGNADKLMLDNFRSLYSDKYDMIAAIALKDLYEILEKAIDQCRDAGNVVALVVLKNS